jgi:hypothetical protein
LPLKLIRPRRGKQTAEKLARDANACARRRLLPDPEFRVAPHHGCDLRLLLPDGSEAAFWARALLLNRRGVCISDFIRFGRQKTDLGVSAIQFPSGGPLNAYVYVLHNCTAPSICDTYKYIFFDSVQDDCTSS